MAKLPDRLAVVVGGLLLAILMASVNNTIVATVQRTEGR